MHSETVNPIMNAFNVVDLGVMRYGDALIHQERAHADVMSQPSRHVIFCVEHEPVLTMGKNSDASNLLFPRDFYIRQGVEIFDTERGGQVTAHMPGQMVIYPILNMAELKLSIRDYVNILEESVIQTLAHFGLRAHRDQEHPGVWIEHEKICALGVRVRSRVSMHGLALNVSNDLSLFGKIIPCGIKFRGVTSIERQLGSKVDMSVVKGQLIDHITSRLVRADISTVRRFN